MFVSLFALAAFAPLQDAAPEVPPAQAVVYASPSGAFELTVEATPDDGSSVCVLTRREKELREEPALDPSREPTQLWSRTFDFAWDDVRVTNAGFVAGTAYTGGGREAWRDSELVVALVAVDGGVLLEQRAERRRSRFLNEPADPKTLGLFVHEDLGRFVVRIADEDPGRGNEEWWTYAIATGDVLARVKPREGLEGHLDLRRLAAARPIPWTPLTLVQWWSGGRHPGIRFAVLDDGWVPVWSLDLPRAYAVLPGEAERLPVIDTHDKIQVDSPRGFTLRLVSEARRAVFSVREGAATLGAPETLARPDGEAPRGRHRRWVVREETRKALYSAIEPGPLPELDLSKLDEVTLGGPRRGNEVYDVVGFALRKGRIEIVREEERGAYTSVLMQRDGTVLELQRFQRLVVRDRTDFEWYPLAGREWFVTAIEPYKDKDERRVRFWRANAATGKVRHVGSMQTPTAAGAVPLDDGGFAVLSGERPRRGDTYLIARGPNPWTVERHKKEPLLRPDSLALTSTGELAVLDAHRDRIFFFSQAGERTRMVDLREKWLKRPHRPYGLTAGPDGTLLVRDRDPLDTTRVIDLDGNVLADFTPRRMGPERSFGNRSLLQLGRGGEVWIGDEKSLYRLRPDGIVGRRIGSDYVERGLRWPGAVHVDFRGRICVQDLVTGAVHVFDHTGRSLQVCRPYSRDFGIGRQSRLAVAPDGSIYASCVREKADHMAFGPAGDWVGFALLGARSVLFDPRSDRRWHLGSTLRLVDDEGRELREIARLPGGRLFEGVSAVAPDGRLAVVNEHSVALYSSDGELEDTFAVALTVVPKLLAYGAAGWLVASGSAEANLIRVKDRAVWRFEVKGALAEESFAYGFSPDGDELWAIERSRNRLHRYALGDR